MSIVITKAKLLKGDKVEISYTRQSDKHKPSQVSEEHADPPHPDLKTAFEDLAAHAACIAEFTSDIDTQPLNITVTGFSMQAEDEGVILSAMKTLKTGKMMQFNCPLLRFEDISEHAYPYADGLLEKIQSARIEVKKYLEGKFAEDAQTEIQFPETGEKITHMQVAEPEQASNFFPHIPIADADAQNRVAGIDQEPKRKRVKQTAETPSGIVE